MILLVLFASFIKQTVELEEQSCDESTSCCFISAYRAY
jgi:hypothetical protein